MYANIAVIAESSFAYRYSCTWLYQQYMTAASLLVKPK